MTVTKVPRKTFTQTIDAVRWVVTGDDTEASVETRKRARLSGPDAVEFLHYVVITDGFASEAQRLRSATVLLETGGFLSSQTKETGHSASRKGTAAPTTSGGKRKSIMARREEWQEQKKFARLLDRWLDPVCSDWTATDPVAPNALSGAIRRARRVTPRWAEDHNERTDRGAITEIDRVLVRHANAAG